MKPTKHRWLRATDWTFRVPKKIGSTSASARDLCSVLDPDGRRCASRADWLEVVHEDPERSAAGWFAVPMCKAHADEHAR